MLFLDLACAVPSMLGLTWSAGACARRAPEDAGGDGQICEADYVHLDAQPDVRWVRVVSTPALVPDTAGIFQP